MKKCRNYFVDYYSLRLFSKVFVVILTISLHLVLVASSVLICRITQSIYAKAIFTQLCRALLSLFTVPNEVLGLSCVSVNHIWCTGSASVEVLLSNLEKSFREDGPCSLGSHQLALPQRTSRTVQTRQRGWRGYHNRAKPVLLCCSIPGYVTGVTGEYHYISHIILVRINPDIVIPWAT